MAQKEQFILTTNTEAGFNELVKARGLAVVDVHANWCGPCKAIVPAFKRLYFDYGERPIRFLTADADNIPALSQFAKKSQPTFQVYKDGDLVETIHGANAPRLTLVVSQNIPDSDVKDEVVEEQNEQEKKELAEEEALFTQKPAGLQIVSWCLWFLFLDFLLFPFWNVDCLSSPQLQPYSSAIPFLILSFIRFLFIVILYYSFLLIMTLNPILHCR
eukprot:TRINITY_DN325_c0_g2_i5.p1 TRINITY_DN325_c0_g2~~TRINITY_DN325_c0_g2_i5.p1  ORF type:complete len:216 (-),score=44.09 TRINITY_DN325_c0_g2_i5:269-916(-)